MRIRKIIHVHTGEAAPEEVLSRLKQGDTLPGGVCVTDREIRFTRHYRPVYLPYDEIVWAYRQVAEVQLRMGCCSGVMPEYRLVLRDAAGREAIAVFQQESGAVYALNAIAQNNPAAAIGFTAENKSRFLPEAEKQA